MTRARRSMVVAGMIVGFLALLAVVLALSRRTPHEPAADAAPGTGAANTRWRAAEAVTEHPRDRAEVAAAAPDRDEVVAVTGRVVDAEFGGGIPGAQVVGSDGFAFDAAFGATVTAADGSFALSGSMRGWSLVRVHVTADGFLPREAQVDLPRDEVEVQLLAANRAAEVVGRLVDARGAPVAGAVVRFEERERPGALDEMIPFAASTKSDATGAFRLGRLLPVRGTVVVESTARGPRTARAARAGHTHRPRRDRAA